MSKLNQEELLEWIAGLHNYSISYYPLTEKQRKQEEKNYQQIKEMIQKPGVTEEWIEEKAELLLDVIVDNPKFELPDIDNAKLFIRSLVEEIK